MQIPLVKDRVFLLFQVGLATWSLRFCALAPVSALFYFRRKLMKKLLSILLAVCMCFSLCFTLASCKSEEEKLVDNPTQEYVIKCLEKVPGILEIEAVTEDTDPMKNLNKPGWYTAHVYFSYQLVNQEDAYGDDLIDKGTDAGGSVEVYKTKKDANKRNEYLSMFDGGVLSSGSHTVVGTCVVRTSDELTASQQNLLESNIIFALQGKDDKIINPNGNSNSSTTSAVGVYKNEEGHTLTIYSNGTLTLLFNGDYWDLEGTWSQNGNTLTYSVWDEGGEWNNPFEDTLDEDGINFLGEYYYRVNDISNNEQTNESTNSNNEPLRESDGLEFELLSNNEYAVKSIGSCNDVDIVIPAFYNGYPVTKISMFCFRENYNIKSVYISENIKKIGHGAFYGCYLLNKVIIENTVEEIESSAFSSCNNITEIIFKHDSKLKKIGSYAFASCVKLTSIDIPISVTSIEDGAFFYCERLEEIVIPLGVTTLSDRVFAGCESLTNITIHNKIKVIEQMAFAICDSLQDIYIPNSVEFIGPDAFMACDNLVIRCEISCKPESWHENWNSDKCIVYWDLKN